MSAPILPKAARFVWSPFAKDLFCDRRQAPLPLGLAAHASGLRPFTRWSKPQPASLRTQWVHGPASERCLEPARVGASRRPCGAVARPPPHGAGLHILPANVGKAARPNCPTAEAAAQTSCAVSAGILERGRVDDPLRISTGMVPSHSGAPVPLSLKMLPPPAGGDASVKASTTT